MDAKIKRQKCDEKQDYLHHFKVSLHKMLITKGKPATLQLEKRGRHHPDQEIKINITGNKKTYQNHVPLDRMDWGEHVTPVVYLLKTHNPNLIMRKHQRTQLKDGVQNNWQICFKSVKVIKDTN